MSDTTKNTKWYVETCLDGKGGEYHDVVDENGVSVLPGDVDEETSHLIAAAPDMLEALEIAREQVLAVCKHNERVNGGKRSEADRRDLEQIDAALAKAKGEGGQL